jgi:hypothetical protein
MFVELMLNIDKENDPLLYLRTLCMALEKTRVSCPLAYFFLCQINPM